MDKETRQNIEQELQHELTKMLSVVTMDKFSDFIVGRVQGGLACKMCGSNDIGVPLRTYLDGKAFLNFSEVDGGGPPHSLFNYEYRLPCNNCGYIHSFAVYPVLNWIETEEGKSEPAE
ncbi:hypothetical protein [Klebsiella michiganensis]|uniref:hypothetical protein n=1 Tax=Klebsiella michiganensis TaxID=1134687 RepID=UPI001E5B22E2|nr:hypothetical protein [Klebsiella michiganensis]MCD6620962.1 hypothetical protein [Klebsiella michiganensis]